MRGRKVADTFSHEQQTTFGFLWGIHKVSAYLWKPPLLWEITWLLSEENRRREGGRYHTSRVYWKAAHWPNQINPHHSVCLSSQHSSDGHETQLAVFTETDCDCRGHRHCELPARMPWDGLCSCGTWNLWKRRWTICMFHCSNPVQPSNAADLGVIFVSAENTDAFPRPSFTVSRTACCCLITLLGLITMMNKLRRAHWRGKLFRNEQGGQTGPWRSFPYAAGKMKYKEENSHNSLFSAIQSSWTALSIGRATYMGYSFITSFSSVHMMATIGRTSSYRFCKWVCND